MIRGLENVLEEGGLATSLYRRLVSVSFVLGLTDSYQEPRKEGDRQLPRLRSLSFKTRSRDVVHDGLSS